MPTRYLRLSDMRREFPEAYANVTSGEWENEKGQTIRGAGQLEGHLFLVTDAGTLLWENGYETLTWDQSKKDWFFKEE